MNALRERSGMTLMEVLGVLTVLAVVINLGATIFVSATRMNAAGMGRLTDLSEQRILFDAVRETVREAAGVEPSLGEFTTDDSCLVLRLGENGVGPCFAVLGAVGHDGKFGRLVYQKTPEGLKLLRAADFDAALGSFRFDTSSSPLISFYAYFENSGAESPPHLIHAAMRGFESEAP